MESLIREYLPTAPDLGLFVAPDIPAKKLSGALSDYARDVAKEDVLALYDATMLGSAKDGAVFLRDRFVYQNNDLQSPRSVRYEDIVGLRSKRKLLGGRTLEVDLNKARATFTESLDFSGQPDAAEYVERFLKEAMLRSARKEQDGVEDATLPGTDLDAVRASLNDLVASGSLRSADRDRMLDALGR